MCGDDLRAASNPSIAGAKAEDSFLLHPAGRRADGGIRAPRSLMLYERMKANLVASWERYATGSSGAFLRRAADVAIAVFPSPPERGVYNNSLLSRALDDGRADAAIRLLEDLYERAGVDGYAVWAHESEAASIACLEAHGYHVDTATRAMAMSLDTIHMPQPHPRLMSTDWPHYVQILGELGAPEGVLTDMDPTDFHAAVGCVDGQRVAAAIAYDYGGDSGIYNVGTLPHARRRGLGTALTAQLLHDARQRGCTTASLQATEIAEHLYAEVGFRDLGLLIEYVR
jgi:ribosomal protein S18 acetylase RimI-like enzyme